MKGNLSDRSPADVLSEVQRQQASGILRLERGPSARQLFIDAGATVCFAASTLPSESMTALFKEKGQVSEESIKQATAAKQGHELLGTVLVRLGILDRSTLGSLTQEHIRRVVNGALLMPDGQYEFQQGSLPFREQLEGGLRVAELLLEWVREVPDSAWIKRRLGSEETRVRMARRPPEGYQTIPLNPAEGYTMSRIDGVGTIREICIVSPMGEEVALRALLGLTLAGIIEIGDESEARKAGPQAPLQRPASAPPRSPSPQTPPRAPDPVSPAASGPTPVSGGAPVTARGAPAPTAKPTPAGSPSSRIAAPGKTAGPAVLPGRTPGNGGAPKRPGAAPPRKTVVLKERVRPTASADLETEVLDRFSRMRDQDLYQVLAVPRGASPDDVRRAYYTLAKRLHPDKFTREEIKPKAEKVFAHITEAYSTLSHADTRAKYEEDLALRQTARPEKPADTGDLARSNFKAGKEHYERGKYQEALSFFQNAAEQDSTKPEYFQYLALTQAKNPRWKKEAEASLLKAIQLNPSEGEYYAQLGTLYAKGGLHSKAREMFKRALEWDSTNTEALEGLENEEGGKKGLRSLFGKK